MFIIQSDLETHEEVWRTFPKASQQYIVDKNIRVAYLDGFKIAREETSHPDLQFRMQGITFQGAFFESTDLAENAGKTKDEILDAIHDTIKAKFGSKGKQVVADNFRTVKRGFSETKHLPVEEMTVGDVAPWAQKVEHTAPLMLLQNQPTTTQYQTSTASLSKQGVTILMVAVMTILPTLLWRSVLSLLPVVFIGI